MTIRDKIELITTLKADDYKDSGDGTVIARGVALTVSDIETTYGKKTIMALEGVIGGEPDKTKFQVFLNAESNNQLIENFGQDDAQWVGKPVQITKETNPKFKKCFLKVSADTVKAQ